MIDPRRLVRTRVALRVLRDLYIGRSRWTAVADIVRELLRSLIARDEQGLRLALAELERIGARRGMTGGGALVDGAVPFSSVPSELVTLLDAVAAELEVAANELRRVPHLDVDGTARPGAWFTVKVYLDTTSPRAGETVDAFVLREPPADLRELVIDVWLVTTGHFEVVSPATATVTVRPDTERSTVASFTVAVRDPVPADAGDPALRAMLDYRLRACGSVRREVPIDGTVPDAARPEFGGAVVQGRADPPDLEVVVKRVPGPADHFDVLLRTILLGGVTVEDTWTLNEGAEMFVSRVMADFVDPKATPTGRQLSLRSAGILFFDAAPKRFRDLYWRMVDAGTPPASMYVISDERAIPWELMIPRRRERGQPWQTMDPLGVSCAIGRWHHEEHLSPRQRIPLSDSLVLAPNYPAPNTLPNAAAERDLVLKWYPGHEVPGTFDELDAFYAANSASLLHFVCHGRDETLQSIKLLRGQTLSAQQMLTSGLATACQARQPLVFLNACEVGRPCTGLTGTVGFPASFIASDASAVVAPLWAVEDQVAHQVAVAFYKAIGDDRTRPFAGILSELRAQAYATGGADSYAAYCYYGDPRASMGVP